MRRPYLRALLGSAALLALIIPSQSVVATTSKDLRLEPWVVIGEELRRPVVEFPETLQGPLLAQDWKGTLTSLNALEEGAEPAVVAFLKGWALIQLGRAKEGKDLIGALDGAPVPSDYLNYVAGSLLWASGDEESAQARLRQIDPASELWIRSQVAIADALVAADRKEDAKERLRALPLETTSGTAVAGALLKLGLVQGPRSPDGRASLKRLSIEHPNTAEARHPAALALRKQAGWATWQEVGLRVERLAKRGQWTTIIEETGPFAGKAPRNGVDGCRFHFIRGKALYRRNRLKDSMIALKGLGEACTGLEQDYGARALYLIGYAGFRRSELRVSARAYGQIPELYPMSRLADDGYTRAGIARLEAEDLAGAQEAWRKGIAEFPKGDTIPEARWRLAWTSYLNGDVDSAIQATERLALVDSALGGRYVGAARYWTARWRMYPDVENPRRKTEEQAREKEAINGWVSLCEDMPYSFYAVLAYSRLREEAPAEAARLLAMKRPKARDDNASPWFVRLSFLENERVRNGVALARIGLVREALAEWDAADLEGVQGAEMAWMTELRWRAGDWLLAHDSMRQWLKSHPVGELGRFQYEVLRVAYPDQYWNEVKAASKPMKFEPRLFHALVREESNFNRNIVSYAGARGLSQVMPGTAAQTAKWLGKSLKPQQLFEPETNLEIGAKYLDVVYKQTGESPFLALASYNAGPGRVLGWVDRFGNLPIDEYVESIPIRQTRLYVKRVMESWQIYRWHFDDDPGFPDLSQFNHYAKGE